MGAAEIGKSLSEEGVPSPDEGCDARHRQDLLDDTSVDATRQDVGQVFEEAVGRAVLQPVVDSVAGAAVLPAGLDVGPALLEQGILVGRGGKHRCGAACPDRRGGARPSHRGGREGGAACDGAGQGEANDAGAESGHPLVSLCGCSRIFSCPLLRLASSVKRILRAMLHTLVLYINKDTCKEWCGTLLNVPITSRTSYSNLFDDKKKCFKYIFI